MIKIKNKGQTFEPYKASWRLESLVKEKLGNKNIDIDFLKDVKLLKVYVMLTGLDKEGISEVKKLLPLCEIIG